jgi:hypothetical protein
VDEEVQPDHFGNDDHVSAVGFDRLSVLSFASPMVSD